MRQFLLLTFFLIFALLCGKAQDSLPVFHHDDPEIFTRKNEFSKAALKKISFSENVGVYKWMDRSGLTTAGAVNRKGEQIIKPVYHAIQKIAPDLWVLKGPSGNYRFYSQAHGEFGFDHCDTFAVAQGVLKAGGYSKWGAAAYGNKKMKLIPQQYKNIEVQGKQLVCQKFASCEVWTENGKKWTVPADSVWFEGGLVLVGKNGKTGLVHMADGKEIIPPVFRTMHVVTMDDGMVKIFADGSYRVYDRRFGFSLTGDSVNNVSPGYVKIFRKNEGWRMYHVGESIDSSRQAYWGIGGLSEGLIPVQPEGSGGLWGYSDSKDSMVIEAKFSKASSFKEGKALVEFEGKRGIIDRQGSWVVDTGHYDLYFSRLYKVDSTGSIHYVVATDKYDSPVPLGRGLVLAKTKGLYGVIDSTGKVVIPFQFNEIRGPYHEEVFIVTKDKMNGFLDIRGNELSGLSDRFEKIFDYKESRARFLKAGKLGFVDTRGNVRVAPQYHEAHDFTEGLAAVRINGKWGFIDKDENIVVQPLYAEVRDFRKGMARCRAGKQWLFVTLKGNRVSEVGYDEIREAEGGKWLIMKKGKAGLADTSGRELLAPRYEGVHDMCNGRVIVKKDGKWGIVDYRENFIVPITYDHISFCPVTKSYALMSGGKEEIISIQEEK